ncbi:MAG: hypothetical protein L6R28_13470 [Planctomycetes bacterium]|nr:hypothetical protein [Planctomycetota bacterium]
MNAPASIQTITPAELKRKIDAGEEIRLIDVREQQEWEHCRIEGAEWKPLSQARVWIGEIDPTGGPYVFYCHHGMRSGQVCMYLAQQGAQQAYNLTGGIDRWSLDVDSSVPRY